MIITSTRLAKKIYRDEFVKVNILCFQRRKLISFKVGLFSTFLLP